MIEIKNLHKSYGDNTVLSGVDFELTAGEFVVVLGPSGAGKSTLLRCINRLTDPDCGEIVVNRKDVANVQGGDLQQLRRNVGMIFQHHNLTKRLSVLKNVLMGRMAELPFWSCALQLFPKKDVELAKRCLAQVGLDAKVYERADSLSGGQQQRVGIARALAQQPQLILADEPVASLDPQSSRKVLSYIRKSCKEQGIAVLCNLHQIDYAMEFGERIIGLSGGKVVFNDHPEHLTPEMVEKIYPGLEDASVNKLVSRMAAERRELRQSESRLQRPVWKVA
ncbi:phosphonate ABC transporter ATP-binding protein [Endozoicomonas lisbonensis]|uniref:Phosphonate transport system ATP-binding protein n=1 Tax=Endozoicomonas lisbonensis TaxID=3120522 RepID=A0ABV2SKT9_9GAMM